YTVTVTVTDDDGGVGSDTFTVNVGQAELPPEADAGGPYVVDEGSSVTLDASNSTDPNGDALTYAWDLDNDGQFDDAVGAMPDFAGIDDGVYTVSVQVSDGGLTDVASTTVTVNNVDPIVEAGANQAANTGDTVSLDPASFTDAGIEDTHIASIDWGDGTVEPGAVTQGAGSGTVDGSHVYTDEGTYTVTVTVTDDDGGVGTDTFTVSIGQAALPPEADAGGPYVVDEGSSVTLDASNSSDPNGDALTYAWDLDNDGQFDDAVGATPDFDGIDDGVYTVSVQVSDGGLTDVASTTVTVNNVDPIVEAGNNQAAEVGDTVTLDPASFTDAGVLDTHIASIDWGDGTVDPGAVTQGAGNGTVNGKHVYTQPGTYTVTVTVTDDDGGVGSDTFLVEIDQPPVQTVFDLRARPKVKKVQLNWTPVQARAGQRTVTYNIYRSSTSGGPYTQIAAGHSNDLGIYIDFEVALGETYYYVITSVVGDNESLFSNEAGATLAPRP
ncbi:MAG: PKD domain-containing protein, partial [Pseudomonadota bacterium]